MPIGGLRDRLVRSSTMGCGGKYAVLGDKTAGGRPCAAGVMLSACVFFCSSFILPGCFFRFYRFSFDVRDPGFRRLLRLALPTCWRFDVQVNVIVLSAFINRSFPQTDW